jgi:hypothetical protein
LQRPILEEPIKTERGKLRDNLLDAFVDIVHCNPVVVQATEDVSVLLLAVDFPLHRGVVKLQLLLWIFDGCDLLEEKRLEVGAFVALRFAFHNALFDYGILLRNEICQPDERQDIGREGLTGKLLPSLFEYEVVLLDFSWISVASKS